MLSRWEAVSFGSESELHGMTLAMPEQVYQVSEVLARLTALCYIIDLR
jgi:hypothetical protein